MAIKVVTIFSAQSLPGAKCHGVDDSTPCPDQWEADDSPTARDAAKEHALESVGHRVRVSMETVHVYRGEER